MVIKALFAARVLKQGWEMVSLIVCVTGTSRGRTLAAESRLCSMRAACPCLNSGKFSTRENAVGVGPLRVKRVRAEIVDLP